MHYYKIDSNEPRPRLPRSPVTGASLRKNINYQALSGFRLIRMNTHNDNTVGNTPGRSMFTVPSKPASASSTSERSDATVDSTGLKVVAILCNER